LNQKHSTTGLSSLTAKIWKQRKAEFGRIDSRVAKWLYLSLDDVERDNSSDLRQNGDHDGEEEEPDEAGGLGGTADPPDQPGEEEGEPQSDDDVRKNLKMK